MESRYHRQQQQQKDPTTPLPSSPASSLFRDISNFKTPKRPPKIPFSPSTQFFTARKATTPYSGLTKARNSSVTVARRLKAFEIEQLKSARRNQVTREKSVNSLAKSLTVWLNFLLENPSSCGCDDVSRSAGESEQVERECKVNGKREAGPGRGVKVGVDGPWRGPKRQRDSKWRRPGAASGDSVHLGLSVSLKDVCSFEDLKERMRGYLSLESCREIFDAMTLVTKSIDDGRLIMRAHCPIVTDVGMKERVMRILMSYNQVWLRIGLFVILGGDSLLPTAEINSEQEMNFLRVVIEKQFFAHPELARAFAYNKRVEGLYRPGYFEKLGSVILKRFLLLVLILDRAKSQSSLPLKYGIDGLDGGSPLLFSLHSNIKSSRQVISDFLSTDVMHGEGNLLAHLSIVGYKVTYQQSPLIEYSFKVTDLYEDLQDGIRLCRAIQLLQHDSSILSKLVVPSDTYKKSLGNCGIALQYLKQAGVPLHDEDGMLITEDDIVNGEKELVLSLLWNIFVHLQFPLLINKQLLSVEISKIRGVILEYPSSCSTLDMLLNWIQAVCESYDLKVENFTSLVDGKAMWCLLDYYFRKEHSCSLSSKDLDGRNEAISLVSTSEYADAVHNFILSQKLTSLLGNFPEVLQVSDLLEFNVACNDRSVIILVVFLSFQLLVKRNLDQLNFHKLLRSDFQTPAERKHPNTKHSFLHSPAVHAKASQCNNSEDASKNFKAIMSWWQDMAQMNNKCNPKSVNALQPCFLTSVRPRKIERENAAKLIQSHFRRMVELGRYLKIRKAACLLQAVIRAWLTVRSSSSFCTKKHSENCGPYMILMVDRHHFIKLKSSVLVIQRAVRTWISYKSQMAVEVGNSQIMFEGKDLFTLRLPAALVIQSSWRKFTARTSLQKQHSAAFVIGSYWRKFTLRKSLQKQHSTATKIQSYFRGFHMRKSFEEQREAILKIQSVLRCLRPRKTFQCYRQKSASAVVIQSHFRRWIAERSYHALRCAVKIQSIFRGWLLRKEFLLKREAAVKIQTAFRCMKQSKAYFSQQIAAKEIQSFVRGFITRKRLLGASFCREISYNNSRHSNYELRIIGQSVIKLQRWWKRVLLQNLKTRSAITIQSYYKRWIACRIASRERQRIVILQSIFRGWLVRKEFLLKREAAVKIQTAFRCMKQSKAYFSQQIAAKEIQSFVRGFITRKRLLGASFCREISYNNSRHSNYELRIIGQSVIKLQRWWKRVLLQNLKTRSAITIQSYYKRWIACRITSRERQRIVILQSIFRGWLVRKEFLLKREAAVKIQTAFRCMKQSKAYFSQQIAAKEIQSFVRGFITRKRLLGASFCREISYNNSRHSNYELRIIGQSVIKLQRWWKRVLLQNLKTRSAIIIQSYYKRWIACRMASRERQRIVILQSYWKGYLARKHSKGQLKELRERVQKSATNVDDSKRLMNRLLAALAELLSMRSMSDILHTCATLDVATEHSQRCCEELVTAGAVGTLLKLVKSVSRSIPDQEILKHALSTLGNLAKYPHLAETLIDSHGFAETVLWELIRNKEEGYTIACNLLKKVCSTKKGLEAVHMCPPLLKRLHSLVEDLKKKAANDKRNSRTPAIREQTDKRLREAVELIELIRNR